MVRIGVIGGGQLAQMMAIASKSLGIDLIVQAQSVQDIAVSVASHSLVGNDYTELIKICSKITFENEFIDPSQLRSQGGINQQFVPTLEAMAILTDKYYQRQFLHSHQLPIPNYFPIARDDSANKLQEYAQQLGYPCVLKVRQHGYDGKGTWVVHCEEELRQAWQDLHHRPAILEAFVPYTKELAIMAGCDSYGQLFLYPVVETIQNQQVCDRVIMPAPIPTDIAIQVAEIARQIVSSIGSAGIFGIELFLTGNGQILVNEIAPRTHNSGHYTIEACNVSQFSQLVRICAGQTAILPQLIYPCAIMVNLLGYEDKLDDYKEKQQLIQELPNVHLHWYGKTHSTVSRKLGHVTIAGDDFTNLAYCADQVRSLWYSPC